MKADRFKEICEYITRVSDNIEAPMYTTPQMTIDVTRCAEWLIKRIEELEERWSENVLTKNLESKLTQRIEELEEEYEPSTPHSNQVRDLIMRAEAAERKVNHAWEVMRDINDTYAPDHPPHEVAEWVERFEGALDK